MYAKNLCRSQAVGDNELILPLQRLEENILQFGNTSMKRILLSLFAILTVMVWTIACAAPTFAPQSVAATPTLVANAAATLPLGNVSATPNPAPGAGQVVNARLNEPFVLQVRQTAILTDTPDQFGITFYNVAEDSRCPQGVACVWAGQVIVQITFQENGLLHPPVLELTTNPQDANHARVIEGYRVELLDVQPPAVAGTPIPSEAYRATFLVTRAEQTPTPVSNTTNGVPDESLTLKFFQPVDFPQADLRVTPSYLSKWTLG